MNYEKANNDGGKMVEFEYSPWKKVIVHEVTKFPLDYFISGASYGVQPGGVGRPLTWADGLIFAKGGLPDSDEIVKEKLQGDLHWNHLHYAIMEKFKPEIKVEGNIRIPIINASDNVIFREMASWIKRSFEEK